MRRTTRARGLELRFHRHGHSRSRGLFLLGLLPLRPASVLARRPSSPFKAHTDMSTPGPEVETPSRRTRTSRTHEDRAYARVGMTQRAP